VYYAVYQNIIAINHFKNEAYFLPQSRRKDNISEIEQLLQSRNIASYNSFERRRRFSNPTDAKHNVSLAKSTVFVVMFSNWYYQRLPKVLKEMSSTFIERYEVSTSPYLFFFDYGDFKIFGSSHEPKLS
jgi:anthranilate synthase component 1